MSDAEKTPDDGLAGVLGKPAYDGFVRVREIGPLGMVTLRGDLESEPLTGAVTQAVGVDLPDIRRISMKDGAGVAWMSPDELLLMMPHSAVTDTVAELADALADQNHLALDVSDARAVFEISGKGAREVLAKLCPVDLASDAFAPGDFRRTRMAQVAVAFWMVDETTFRVICFRSVAEYVFGLLKISAAPGSEVGFLER